MKIYTKTGDKGNTTLFNGERIPKNDPHIEALGTIDECNSAIGIALTKWPKNSELTSTKKQLESIQHTLFDLGAAIASNGKISPNLDPDELEKWIDKIATKIPSLTAFILPGGHEIATHIHFARTICRRAERSCVPLEFNPGIIYLNRLSDYLFMAARLVNVITHTKEVQWTSTI